MHLISKSRYRGTILLASAVLFVGLINYLFAQYSVKVFQPENYQENIRILDSIVALLPVSENQSEYNSSGLEKDESFDNQSKFRPANFNPNTVSEKEWLEMGLPSVAFQSLNRYRKKGGVFRRAEQIFKVPHLSNQQAEEIIPWLQLDSGRNASDLRKVFSAKKVKEAAGPFDLNLADSIQLKSVFGIGSKTAARIVRYREDLGGFVSKTQVLEVWGLDTLVGEELMDISYLSQTPVIRRLEPNSANEEELARHPYIRKGLARLIVRYRNQHPPFKRPEDLLGIRLFRPEQLEKLKPYLRFE